MGKHRAQILFAQTIVVLQIVALVLQSVEGLVLDTPPGTAGTHDIIGVLTAHLEISYPTEPLLHISLVIGLPVLQEIDCQLTFAGFVQGNMVEKTKAVMQPRLLEILDLEFRRSPRFQPPRQPVEKDIDGHPVWPRE